MCCARLNRSERTWEPRLSTESCCSFDLNLQIPAETPPSEYSAAKPTTKLDIGRAKNNAALAISAGWAIRFTGCKPAAQVGPVVNMTQRTSGLWRVAPNPPIAVVSYDLQKVSISIAHNLQAQNKNWLIEIQVTEVG